MARDVPNDENRTPVLGEQGLTASGTIDLESMRRGALLRDIPEVVSATEVDARESEDLGQDALHMADDASSPQTLGGTIVIDGSLRGASPRIRQRRDTDAVEASLLLPDGQEVVAKLRPEDAPFLIGRNRNRCNLPVADMRASRIHVALSVMDGDVCVEDQSSRNGTFVNGERVEGRTVIADGDTVRVGRTEIGVRLARNPSA